MTRPNLRRTLATVAVAAGLLAAAAPAGADVIAYNGHAGLGTNVYQHSQTDLEHLIQDGTSNTIIF
jgi:hypothetical protein